MTPSEIETQARNKYNATNDTFWVSSEIFHLIYEACMELAIDADMIEDSATALSVSGTADYTLPTRALKIKRMTYNGNKVQPISAREADSLRLQPVITTTAGTPQYYTEWDGGYTLIPTPAVSSDTIAFEIYKEPATITSGGQTLEVPTWTHPGIVNFVLREMCAKDENPRMAEYYGTLWENTRKRAIKQRQRKKRGDSFATVLNEDVLVNTGFGSV